MVFAVRALPVLVEIVITVILVVVILSMIGFIS
jgi:hypothetical protein